MRIYHSCCIYCGNYNECVDHIKKINLLIDSCNDCKYLGRKFNGKSVKDKSIYLLSKYIEMYTFYDGGIFSVRLSNLDKHTSKGYYPIPIDETKREKDGEVFFLWNDVPQKKRMEQVLLRQMSIKKPLLEDIKPNRKRAKKVLKLQQRIYPKENMGEILLYTMSKPVELKQSSKRITRAERLQEPESEPDFSKINLFKDAKPSTDKQVCRFCSSLTKYRYYCSTLCKIRYRELHPNI